jgi:hypothetical protein
MKRRLAIAGALVVIACVVLWLVFRDRGGGNDAAPAMTARPTKPIVVAPRPAQEAEAARPSPGQGRAAVEQVAVAGGIASGRVINWSTGDGVAGADLTFTGDGGAVTVRSAADGVFELAPASPGTYVLAAIGASGFLPYAPELSHSTIRFALAKDRAVRGITVFLYPAIDYHGKVVDAAGAPVAGASVKLLGTPQAEQVIDRLTTEWTTAKDGTFTFHAADDAVLEAVRGKARGWARVENGVQLTRELVIKIAEAPARDATITGRTVDHDGKPLADVLVRALPQQHGPETVARSVSFTTSGPDGVFVLEHLDRGNYDIQGELPEHAPSVLYTIAGGARDVTLVIDRGITLAGKAVTTAGDAVPSYTLTVYRREGALRDLTLARSIVDPSGAFEVHVPAGDYDLSASAPSWAPSDKLHVDAKQSTSGLVLTLPTGATLRGVVVAADDRKGLQYARVSRESFGGGASAAPANAGTVTRADGTFELTGIPPGQFSVRVDAGLFHPKIEGGMTATDNGAIGPITIALARLRDGETPSLELVGIGVALGADGDALRVNQVYPNSGAAAAGIIVGDHIVAVDGLPTADLGVDGAVAKIRGVEGTTVAITLRRGDTLVPLVVERRKLHA